MDNQECAVCKKMMKSKHKFDKLYKIGFWIFFIISVVMSVLFFCEGDLFATTTTEKVVNVENNTEVDINDSNNNTVSIDNGSYDIS